MSFGGKATQCLSICMSVFIAKKNGTESISETTKGKYNPPDKGRIHPSWESMLKKELRQKEEKKEKSNN